MPYLNLVPQPNFSVTESVKNITLALIIIFYLLAVVPQIADKNVSGHTIWSLTFIGLVIYLAF